MPAAKQRKSAKNAGLDKDFLDILACPACGSGFNPLVRENISCLDCGREYPVKNGIPVLIIEKAVMPVKKR
ncbi:MAG: Trm112 family protein [Candidatus Omnitrophota bacterium]|jgi:hypothetical protein